MKQRILIALIFAIFSALNIATSDARTKLHVCAGESCQDCICLSCTQTFTIYHANGDTTGLTCSVGGPAVCCDIEITSLDTGDYYVNLTNLCHDCNTPFHYDGTSISITVDCTHCLSDKSEKINNLLKGNLTQITYSLSQNYPNPFNPTTSISYGLPKAGSVKLIIYDLSGKTVAILVDGYKEAGNYSADFDASNIASGIYFYKLSVDEGTYSQIKKMVLIK